MRKARDTPEVTIDSVNDLEALPEGEWSFAPEGMNIELDFSRWNPDAESLRVRLPRSVVKRLRAKPGSHWSATIAGNMLVFDELPNTSDQERSAERRK